MKLYRDCAAAGAAPYDNPAYLGIFDINGNLKQSVTIAFPGSTRVPSSFSNACFQPPTNICVEEAIYTTTVNLPPITGGYVLSYQRCCRNATILNIINPTTIGTTYTAQIPDSTVADTNSSPHFNHFPPIFLCNDVPFTFDHSAADPDGDSLVYSLSKPYQGLSSFSPGPGIPTPPPYSFVPFSIGYSGTYPMSSSPAMSINSKTGLITATPNTIGQWVVGVSVKEYRHGVLLSENKRDFQFNVINCPAVPVSSIPSQQVFCAGYTVNFQNNSVNSTTYHWDFGDSGTANDTSNVVSPSWTYSGPGTYTVILIASPGQLCADTGYSTFQVYPKIIPDFVPPDPQCIFGNNFDFAAGGSYLGNNTTAFFWNFSSKATPASSNTKNPTGIVYHAVGTFSVTLTISENGCDSSHTGFVTVDTLPVISISGNNSICLGSKANLLAEGGKSYLWNTGSTNSLISVSPVINTSYTVQVSNEIGCSDSSSYTVIVNALPTVVISKSQTICAGSSTSLSASGGSGYEWIPAAELYAASTANPTASPTVTTTYTVIVSNGTCSNDASNIVSVYPFVNTVCCNTTISTGQSVTLVASPNTGTKTYSWVPNINLNCNVCPNPIATPTITTAYYVLINDDKGCSETDSVIIKVLNCLNVLVPNVFTPNKDNVNDIFYIKLQGDCVESFTLKIFDRWGLLMFESSDPANGWDGKYKGKEMEAGVFFYILDAKLINGTSLNKKGNVTLMR